MKYQYRENEKGFSMVEVVLATSIILGFLLALFSINNLYLKTALSNTDSMKATFLAEESLEAMRFLRDLSWHNNIQQLSTTTDYNLVFESNLWKATTTVRYVDSIFEREVALDDVYRNSSSDIVSTGGTADPNTRLIIATVSWFNGSATTTKSISTYLSNISGE